MSLSQVLAVPGQQLANAIAAEWDQQFVLLKPVEMPLMTLACTTSIKLPVVPTPTSLELCV
jgi:chaperone required for assembly of F1-ATPase